MKEEDDFPSPDDFCNYLPWACNQLGVPTAIVINRIIQTENISALTDRGKKARSRIKLNQSTFNIASDQDNESIRYSDENSPKQHTTNITAIYNNNNNLVEIRFERNRNIPRLVMKVIRLIVHFHYYLNRVHMNGGVDKYIIHEINGIIKTSHITEICLDNCFVSECNYSILLETGNSLRYLSLSKCKINYTAVKEILKNLEYPKQASETLIALNLSINMITDCGAKLLAKVLRSNRKLSYINLADNSITDDGATYLFDVLKEFPLKDEELHASRVRQSRHVKEKMDSIKQTIEELLSGNIDRKLRQKMKSQSVLSLKRKKPIKNSILKSRDVSKENLQSTEDVYDTAVKMVDENMGEFEDPFMSKHTVIKDNIVYCKGNNTLLYINLAYNNLTFLTIKKIRDVLMYQRLMDRVPIGVINVLLEGNNLPASCIELKQLDELIELGTKSNNRKLSYFKKRPQSKTSSR